MGKKILACFLCICLLLSQPTGALAEEPLELTAVSAILIEPKTGTVIYEKNADESLYPASITKIMTLILIYDALAEGKITKDDVVTVSEYAASMGGSQVFLEAGEQQTVDTLIKCISVASANDGCVAMAEYIWGSEAAFVEKMNERAQGLGMTNTTFVNCCGLDTEGHCTTARDVALMSRELTVKYPDIFSYTKIWMENITHVTARGSSEFGLANTNKLMKQYPYATGLKTGSTGLAKYCVSATASRDGMDLIAVVMAAADYKVRFREAAALLDYGFATCHVYTDPELPELSPLPVRGGVQESVPLEYGEEFSWLITDGSRGDGIERTMELDSEIEAPVEEGQSVGRLIYSLNGKELGQTEILAGESVKQAGFRDYFRRAVRMLLHGNEEEGNSSRTDAANMSDFTK